MTARFLLLATLAAGLVLGGCDKPKGANRPSGEAASAFPPPVKRSAPVRPVEPISWDEASGRFTLNGLALETAHLWRFDGADHGFSAVAADLSPAPGGLRITGQMLDPILRSPQNLNFEGGRYNAVIVRLTRVREGGDWDGSLFYTTPKHGESADFFGRPLRGADPVAGEMTTMVYDMGLLRKGQDDWINSTITGLRFDFDNQPGGAFVIHQIAVVALPSASNLRPSQ